MVGLLGGTAELLLFQDAEHSQVLLGLVAGHAPCTAFDHPFLQEEGVVVAALPRRCDGAVGLLHAGCDLLAVRHRFVADELPSASHDDHDPRAIHWVGCLDGHLRDDGHDERLARVLRVGGAGHEQDNQDNQEALHFCLRCAPFQRWFEKNYQYTLYTKIHICQCAHKKELHLYKHRFLIRNSLRTATAGVRAPPLAGGDSVYFDEEAKRNNKGII